MQGGRQETNDKFLKYGQEMEIDWETIKAKIKVDKEREAEANR